MEKKIEVPKYCLCTPQGKKKRIRKRMKREILAVVSKFDVLA